MLKKKGVYVLFMKSLIPFFQPGQVSRISYYSQFGTTLWDDKQDNII